MTKRYFLLMGLIGMLFVFVSCAATRLEMDYGTSAKLVKFNQILNPEAEKNLEPVTGFDGVAAGNTIDRYRKGFQEKSEPPVYTINIGTRGK